MKNQIQPQISVIVPVYNEKEIIQHLVHKIYQTMEKVGKTFKIIVVDDGSFDGTSEILSKIPYIYTITHPYNKGNGAAIKTGIRNTKSSLLILMDGDGQHDPTSIPELLSYSEDYELVVGSRTNLSSQSLPRFIANRTYNILSSYITGHKILDLTSGYRVVHREKITTFIPLFPNGFSYPTTSTLAFYKSGFSVKFVPVKMKNRAGFSKISPVQDGLRFFMIIMKITTLFSPMKIFLPASILSVLIGISHALYKIFVYDLRYTSLSVLFITTGIIIFMIGLVSEQISMLRFERINE